MRLPRSPIACAATCRPQSWPCARSPRTLGLGHQQAAVAGIVAVVGEQRGAAAAERAVHVQLDAAHLRAGLRSGDTDRRGTGRRTRPCRRRHRRRCAAAAGRCRRSGGTAPASSREVPMSCTPVSPMRTAASQRALQRLLTEDSVRWRHRILDQPRGLVDEDAGRFALCAQDAAAFGLPVAREIARGFAHRGGIRPAGVAVDALQPHRAARETRRRGRPQSERSCRASRSGPSRGRAARRPRAGSFRTRAGARSPRPCRACRPGRRASARSRVP